MKPIRFLSLAFLILIFAFSTSSYADVPQMINYQGKITTTAGALINDTLDMTFKIYGSESGTDSLWWETQSSVVVENGIFSVLLGSVNPIADGVFDGSVRYLGIKVGDDSEMTPRRPIVSVPYAYRSGSGNGSSNCHDCDTVFVNAVGPDSVVTTTGTAFLGKASGSTGDLFGVKGFADNSSSGNAYGGYFSASPSGTGNRFGVYGGGYSSSAYVAIGCAGHAENTSNGGAVGGEFGTSSSGTGGPNYGVSGLGQNASSGDAIGCGGTGLNYSTGDAYGGEFRAGPSGTGTQYGVHARAIGNSSASSYGLYGYGVNTESSGNVYGGYFKADAGGTGIHYGVYGVSSNFSGSVADAYGGYFKTEAGGTGNRLGVYAEANSSSEYIAIGCWGSAENTSNGGAIGGDFGTSSAGTGGPNYGVSGLGQNASSGDAIGCGGTGLNYSTGDAYGGTFRAGPAGTGIQYGVYARALANSSASTYAFYGYGAPVDPYSGNVYGGYFWAAVGGTGTHYGVYGREQAGGTGAAVYASGDFAGSGAKYAVTKTSRGHRLLSVIESPEVWFEDFGDGELVNGKAHVELDPLFLETVTISAQHPMKVFVQLTSGDPMNVVVKKGLTDFEVVAENLVSMSTFDWRVVAKRKGYETERLRETSVGYDDPELYPELKTDMEKEQPRMLEERARIEQERMKQEKEREESETE